MIFKETQKFRQIWLWVLLIATALFTTGIFAIGIYRQIFEGQKFGNNPMSDNGLIIVSSLVLLINIAVLLLFGISKMTVVIDKTGIEYSFFPFHSGTHHIYWEMIDNFKVIRYDPVKDYGGWGVRFSRKGGAYTVSGNKGLLLYLRSGKRILIGTQRDLELTNFLTKFPNPGNHNDININN
jgi:hypothetical protein